MRRDKILFSDILPFNPGGWPVQLAGQVYHMIFTINMAGQARHAMRVRQQRNYLTGPFVEIR